MNNMLPTDRNSWLMTGVILGDVLVADSRWVNDARFNSWIMNNIFTFHIWPAMWWWFVIGGWSIQPNKPNPTWPNPTNTTNVSMIRSAWTLNARHRCVCHPIRRTRTCSILPCALAQSTSRWVVIVWMDIDGWEWYQLIIDGYSQVILMFFECEWSLMVISWSFASIMTFLNLISSNDENWLIIVVLKRWR